MSRHDDAMRRNAIDRLRKTIRDLHALESIHVQSAPVDETFQGKPVWQGVVEVFSVSGHPQAKFAYAWSYIGDKGETRYTAVLGVPPIDSPQKAVQAAVMAHIEKQRKGGEQ
jgi:hypothetical protein